MGVRCIVRATSAAGPEPGTTMTAAETPVSIAARRSRAAGTPGLRLPRATCPALVPGAGGLFRCLDVLPVAERVDAARDHPQCEVLVAPRELLADGDRGVGSSRPGRLVVQQSWAGRRRSRTPVRAHGERRSADRARHADDRARPRPAATTCRHRRVSPDRPGSGPGRGGQRGSRRPGPEHRGPPRLPPSTSMSPYDNTPRVAEQRRGCHPGLEPHPAEPLGVRDHLVGEDRPDVGEVQHHQDHERAGDRGADQPPWRGHRRRASLPVRRPDRSSGPAAAPPPSP